MSQNVWATIMPFGPVTLIFYWPKKKNSGQQMLALIKKGSILSPISVLLYKVVIKLAPITGVHLLFKNKSLDDQILSVNIYDFRQL
jgi:hypothetical protein